jgi:ABC-type multidrug transport system permease subunit
MSVKKQTNKEPEMQPKNFALSKINFIIIGVAVVIIITGFVLMTGPSTTLEGGFEPDIFSARRIKVAPLTCFIGFLVMIVGILFPDKKRKQSSEA